MLCGEFQVFRQTAIIEPGNFRAGKRKAASDILSFTIFAYKYD
jgi:hypothetical protein